MRKVYLDHAATTPVKPEVLEAMLPYFSEFYGNAASVYELGRQSKKAIEAAREAIARNFGAEAKEIFFTASGTEADNWVIKGLAWVNQAKGKHIITSQIEHHAILHSCQFLETQGFEVTYLPVDHEGLVAPADLAKAIRQDTILVSIMMANNEVGTIQPILELAKIAKKAQVFFHTDAVQAVGNLSINVKELGLDALSFSGHKFGAPKGIGGLYLRSGVKIDNLLHGGSQERDLRGGTHNVAGIVGMAKALELATANLEQRRAHLLALRERTITEIMQLAPQAKLNGHRVHRLPGNVNFSFPGLEGDVLLMQLDMKGIAASSGSACSALSIEPSHVLTAMGLQADLAKSALRLTFGEDNTSEDVDYLLATLKEILA